MFFLLLFIATLKNQLSRYSELLHTLAMFAFATDATLPGIREFLASYLKRAGTAALLAADALHSDAIEEALRDVLWLVERLPVEPFATLRSALLAPLTDVFNAGGPAAKVRVLASLRALATRWASSLDSLTAAADDDDDGAASSATAVRALWRHVTRLADLALAAHPTHALIEHHVLLVYERAARLHQQHGCAFVIDPPRALVQRGLVSLNATALSRVCGLIVQLSVSITPVLLSSILCIQIVVSLSLFFFYLPDGIPSIRTNEQRSNRTGCARQQNQRARRSGANRVGGCVEWFVGRTQSIVFDARSSQVNTLLISF